MDDRPVPAAGAGGDRGLQRQEELTDSEEGTPARSQRHRGKSYYEKVHHAHTEQGEVDLLLQRAW